MIRMAEASDERSLGDQTDGQHERGASRAKRAMPGWAQVRRLLALALVLEGHSRTEAAVLKGGHASIWAEVGSRPRMARNNRHVFPHGLFGALGVRMHLA